MGVAAGVTDKPAEGDLFSAQPIGAGAAGSDSSHSSSSNAPAPAPRPKALKPLDPVEEAVKEKNLVSQKKLADLAVEEKAVRDLKARREQTLLEMQRAMTVAQDTKAASSHARVTGLFSAAAKAGSQADQIEDLAAVLARLQEQQKDEKRKIEARELDPSIQTEAETEAESTSAVAASAPRPPDIIGRWKEVLQESKPYQEADSFIRKMHIDAKLQMMTPDEYMDLMAQYQKDYEAFVTGEATKMKGTPRASIDLAGQFWKNLLAFGWEHYRLEYARKSKILNRAFELEQRYFEERKAN